MKRRPSGGLIPPSRLVGPDPVSNQDRAPTSPLLHTPVTTRRTTGATRLPHRAPTVTVEHEHDLNLARCAAALLVLLGAAPSANASYHGAQDGGR